MKKMTTVYLDVEDLEELRQGGGIGKQIRKLVEEYLRIPPEKLKARRCRTKKTENIMSLLELIIGHCEPNPDENKCVPLMMSEGLSLIFGKKSYIVEVSESLQYELKKHSIEMYFEFDMKLRLFTYHFPDGVDSMVLEGIINSL